MTQLFNLDLNSYDGLKRAAKLIDFGKKLNSGGSDDPFLNNVRIGENDLEY